MKEHFKRKKMKATTKAKVEGLVIGLLLGTLGTSNYHIKNSHDYANSRNNNINTLISADAQNLLFKEDSTDPLIINSLSEVSISEIHKDNDKDSNTASTTISIANSKSKNTLISDTIARAEVREDGNLIKIIDVEDNIIGPHSIESIPINFPVSNSAKELKIEVFSPSILTPISTKTFNLSPNKEVN